MPVPKLLAYASTLPDAIGQSAQSENRQRRVLSVNILGVFRYSTTSNASLSDPKTETIPPAAKALSLTTKLSLCHNYPGLILHYITN